jgi:hypothetical protein
VVSQLKLSPKKTMIDATWELQEPTGKVFRYLISWIPDGVSFATAFCYVNSPAISTSACDVYPTLKSCTLYTVTVQPRAIEGSSSEYNTGTPASAAAYTLTEGERGKHSFFSIRKGRVKKFPNDPSFVAFIA